MLPRLIVCVPLCAAALCACTLTPAGMDEERRSVERAGAPYEPRFEGRSLPELPDHPEWWDVLHRAFLANGELESAYFEWKAALARVDAAGAWPNSDLNVGFSYAFSAARMKSFDRATFTLMPDPARNLTLPVKAAQAAKVALAQARAAGERFRAAKFDVQKRALFAWAEYTLRAREIGVARRDLALLRVQADAARVRAEIGGQQGATIGGVLAVRMAESRLADLDAEHAGQRAALNAMMEREPHAELAAPERPAEPRHIPADDAALLAASAEMFPEVATLAQETRGRAEALELARLRWIPDFNPVASFTGTVMQAIGVGVMLPTTVAEVRANIHAAEAELRASEARLRQRKVDRIGEYVALLVTLRRAQQREALFSGVVLPGAKQLTRTRALAYEVGAGTLSDLVEAQRMELETELVVARSQAEIEKAIVDIECCLGVDIETIPPALPAAGGNDTGKTGDSAEGANHE